MQESYSVPASQLAMQSSPHRGLKKELQFQVLYLPFCYYANGGGRNSELSDTTKEVTHSCGFFLMMTHDTVLSHAHLSLVGHLIQ